jgi:hypothetical protein
MSNSVSYMHQYSVCHPLPENLSMNSVIHYDDGDGNGILYYPCLIKLNSALTYCHNLYIKSIIDDIKRQWFA